jgi:uncharacterized protein (DUF2267 family)
VHGQVTGSHRWIVGEVRRAGGFEKDGGACRALEAVLGEPAFSLAWGDTWNMSARMPRRLRELMAQRSFQPSMARFSASTFLRRVGEQEGVDERTAARHVEAVSKALRSHMPAVFSERIREELAALWRTLPRVLGEGVAG